MGFVAIAAPLVALYVCRPGRVGFGDVRFVTLNGLVAGWWGVLAAWWALAAGSLLVGLSHPCIRNGARRPRTEVHA